MEDKKYKKSEMKLAIRNATLKKVQASFCFFSKKSTLTESNLNHR